MSNPIFYDPHQRRGPIIKSIILAIAGVIILLLINFVISLINNPILPKPLGLQQSKPDYHYNPLLKARYDTSKKTLHHIRGLSQNYSTISGNLINIYAFYVERDDNSWTAMTKHLNKIENIIPERLQITSTGIKELYPDKASRTLAYIRSHNSDTKITPLINNFDSENGIWSGGLVHSIISDKSKRKVLIDKIIGYIDKQQLDGISIDFENMDSATRKLMTSFLEELSIPIHQRGLSLTINMPLDIDNGLCKTFTQYVDKVFFMAYDEHWSSGTAGPIASIGRYESGLQSLSGIDTHHIGIALGNYGYNRTTGKKDVQTMTWQEIMTTMRESSGKIHFDASSLNPMYQYYDEKNQLHQVWYLDAITAYNQMVLARNQHIDSFALWRLGGEDPSFRNIIDNNQLDQDHLPTVLQDMSYGYDINYQGSGILLQLVSSPTTGSRDIHYDSDQGIITDESITKFATPYTIERYVSSHPKQLLLTFDDGPSPDTTKILDILHKYHVPALFFIIGNNAELYPSIVERMYNEGHTIGNHTFSHPDISLESDKSVDFELNTTQRIIEAITKHSTILFRPPYSIDIEPSTPAEASILPNLKKLGYYIMGLDIDPDDWENPGSEQIIQKIQEGATNGNVILLHDGGGDRSQTIQALPHIIKQLQSEGYTFVSASQLLGVSKETFMPPLVISDRILSLPNYIAINRTSAFIHILSRLFLAGIIMGISRLLIIITLALWQSYTNDTSDQTEKEMKPLVSVLIPAYNEGVVIVRTIANLLESDYLHIECVVIDDGSTDNTYDSAISIYGSHPQIRIVTQSNGGKAKALNYGISLSKGEIIIIQDADTLFDTHAISALVKHFSDHRIGAVAGNVKVGNTKSILGRCQAIEYVTSQNLDRRAFDLLNCITVVPGAIGARRRNIIQEVGGLTSDTLAEDADLTIKVLRAGYRIAHEEGAIAWTEAPESISAFCKQRFRWMFGTLQVLWKHSEAFFSLSNPGLGWFALPNLFIFQLFFPLLGPVLDIVGIINIIILVFHLFGHYSQTATAHSEYMLMWYIVFILVDATTTIISFVLENNKQGEVVARFPLQRILYRLLMYSVGIKVFYKALSGNATGWNKLERKGTVIQ